MIDREWTFDGHQDNLLDEKSPEQIFKMLDGQAWINRYRKHQDGQLDIESTAKEVDIPVKWQSPDEPYYANAWITGLKPEAAGTPIEITIGVASRPNQQSVSFGHELGHYFLFQHGLVPYKNRSSPEENFSEYFGRQVALPTEYLSGKENFDGPTIMQIAELFHVEVETVILQLMEIDKLPRRVFVDTGNGPTKNPLFDNKVDRATVCADCSQELEHEPPKDAFSSEELVIDMTAYDLANGFSFVACKPEFTFNLNNLRELNVRYGRWSEDDEVAFESDKIKQAERLERYKSELAKVALKPKD